MELLSTRTDRSLLRLAGVIALASAVCSTCAQLDATSAVRAYLDPDTAESEQGAV